MRRLDRMGGNRFLERASSRRWGSVGLIPWAILLVVTVLPFAVWAGETDVEDAPIAGSISEMGTSMEQHFETEEEEVAPAEGEEVAPEEKAPGEEAAPGEEVPSEGEAKVPPGQVQKPTPKPEAAVPGEVPEEVEEVPSPEAEELPALFPFFADTSLKLHLRTYYFDRNNSDNTENEAWALGGSISYRSGSWRDFLSIGADLFTSQKLYGPRDRDGTTLLRPGQRSYTVLGRAYATLRHSFGGVQLTSVLGRQFFDLPYVNRNDSRMTPITFEGYSISGNISKVKAIAGYVTKVKLRDSDEFVSMSEAVGVDTVDRPMILFGAIYQPTPQFNIGAINEYVEDLFNVFYSETKLDHTFDSGVELRVAGQLTDQRSVGDKLLTGESFNTQSWGLKAASSYMGGVLTLTLSTTTQGREIQNPYGRRQAFVAMMGEKFIRAGEEAWQVAFAYDFAKVGIDGFSGLVKYGSGRGAVHDLTGEPLPDQQEFDLTLDYRLQSVLPGLWLRVRGAIVDRQRPSEGGKALRVVLRYDIPVL